MPTLNLQLMNLKHMKYFHFVMEMMLLEEVWIY